MHRAVLTVLPYVKCNRQWRDALVMLRNEDREELMIDDLDPSGDYANFLRQGISEVSFV